MSTLPTNRLAHRTTSTAPVPTDVRRFISVDSVRRLEICERCVLWRAFRGEGRRIGKDANRRRDARYRAAGLVSRVRPYDRIISYSLSDQSSPPVLVGTYCATVGQWLLGKCKSLTFAIGAHVQMPSRPHDWHCTLSVDSHRQ